MKISINYKPVDSPWGGGNQFVSVFCDYFRERGHTIVHTLDDDTDVAVLIDPRRGENKTFIHTDVAKIRKKRNPNLKMLHRINDTDIARGTAFLDKLILNANRHADSTIFISEWLMNYFDKAWNGLNNPSTVVRNGAAESIFHSQCREPWNGRDALKLVTHHWSNNWNKGFDIYKQFDSLLDDEWMRERFEFTYIGRYPAELQFKNTNCLPPLFGKKLAQELRSHHVYLTASKNEACGMHHIEGSLCGLPVLFGDQGGGIVECCKDFGLQFSDLDFPAKLFKMKNMCISLQEKMKDYPLSSSFMMKGYEQEILKLMEG